MLKLILASFKGLFLIALLLTMKYILSSFKIQIQESIYLKDPESSELGKRIVQGSIKLIDQMGFEDFTFKKLGNEIASNESSIYRYFENKHKLLIYLTSWYWAWIEYNLVLATIQEKSDWDKLNSAIEVCTRATEEDGNFSHIDEIALNRIVINENSKSYLTKEVDQENKAGYFEAYKRVIFRLKSLIQTVDPRFEFPSNLAVTIIESALHQHFNQEHFPSLSDCNSQKEPTKYIKNLVQNILKNG